ncbi:MAG: hypothetical protein IT200_06865 [Thermoleophilia bacterium]|nr:hypothetical protein [Thermoleophilia bacterium]
MTASAAVARAAALTAPLGVTAVPGGPATDAWATAADAAREPALARLVARRAAALDTADRRVAATFLLEGWAWSVAAPAVAAALHEGRVPDPCADAVRLSFAADGTVAGVAFTGPVAVLGADPLAGAAGTVTVGDGPEDLAAWLRARLTGGHLAHVVAALAPLAGRSEAALWASVHDMLSGALVHLAGAAVVPVDPQPLAAALFGTAPLRAAPRFVPGDTACGLDRLRVGCCQVFRLGADRCAACPGAPSVPGARRDG